MDSDSFSLNDLLDALRIFPTLDAYEAAPDAERDRFHRAEDELVRRALDDALHQSGAIIDALIAGLHTDHWGLRAGAIYALGEIRAVRAVQPLIEAFRDDVSSMAEIVSALVNIGTIAVRPLIHALTDQPDPAIRRGAALTLARFRDPLAVPALIARLADDPDAGVRTFAAHALAPLCDARAVQPLIEALDADADPQVREAAARSLGEIGALLRNPGLIAALRRALADPDWGVRQSAAEMLIHLNEDSGGGARALLIADLTHPDAAIRLGAAWSLLPTRDPRIVDPLVRLLYHPEGPIAASAARALGEAGDRRAIPGLEALRAHSDPAVRHAAQEALDRLRPQA
jgi:HEAT repeat protein